MTQQHHRDSKRTLSLDVPDPSIDAGDGDVATNLSVESFGSSMTRSSSSNSNDSTIPILSPSIGQRKNKTSSSSSSKIINILRKFFEYLDPQAIENFKFHTTPADIFFNNKEKISKKTKNIFESRHKTIQEQLSKLDSKFENIFFDEPTTLEKLFYSATLLNLFLIGYIMGQLPEYFHIYYTFVFFLLMPLRFYTYYKTKQHYFMADLCYYVNFMVLAFIWCFPNSKDLYISSFALTFGTLCWAVITWRNSLVVHSMDKVTSCFIHIMPPLTLYVIHYILDGTAFQEERFPIVALLRNTYVNGTKKTSWSMKSSVFYTSLYYLGWQILYHYFITFKKSEKLKSKQRMTSFRYLTEHTFKETPILKEIVHFKEPWPMVLYTLLQYLYQLLTMSLCSIWFQNRTAATMFLTTIFCSASYRGATYYVDRYMDQSLKKEVKRLQLEIRSLQGNMKPEDLLLP